MTISEILLIVFAVVIIALVLVIIFTKIRKPQSFDFDKKIEGQNQIFSSMSKLQMDNIKNYNDSVVNIINQNLSMQSTRLNDIQNRIDSLLKNNEEKLNRASDVLEKGLTKLQEDNSKKLEEMRQTVDEKLNTSLEKRLTESFSLVSQRLEAVYKGLGEMQQLAVGVGDLKRVLSNVKTRGVYGEISLDMLLEQILTKEQYIKNASVKKNSLERVDYAIKLPGKDGESILLPIDVKFPIEDYQRLAVASEQGSSDDVETALKQLEKRIKEEAKSISEKYINVPSTTDFAVLYLATEGLYCEAVKREGLIEFLQQKYRVIVCGPSTISALLNSLQLGFRTLAIEKRSSEIWKLLEVFKKDFDTFTDLLSKTQKKLTEASDTIESATKRTQIIAKKLRTVSILGDETKDVLTDIIDESGD